MGGVAVATIVAKNYLSHARVLADSFLRHHPEVPFFVLLADEIDGYFDPAGEPFHMLRLEDVGIPDLTRFCLRKDLKGVASAAKPYLLGRLFDEGFADAIFLDPDILVLQDLAPLFSHVSRHAVVVVPHLLAPLEGDGRAERELNVLQSGVYNAGLVGVSDKPGARAFLKWWQERVLEHCRHDVPRGMHYDQRWLDLAPIFFEDVFILREPVYNVAHWNLPERNLLVRGDEVLLDGHPCRLFHFSGYDPDRPDEVTRYNARLDMANIGSTVELFRRYLALLEKAGYRETKRWPYAYGRLKRDESAARRTGEGSENERMSARLLRSLFDRLNRLAGGRRLASSISSEVEHQALYGKLRDSNGQSVADGKRSTDSSAPVGEQSEGVADSSFARRIEQVGFRPFGVNIVGYLASEKGIGEAARSLARSLSAANVPFVLNNYEDFQSSNHGASFGEFSGDNPYKINLICIDPAAMVTFAARYGASYFEGRYNIAHWPWELSDFPREWVTHFRHLDEVWAPSSFARQSLAKVSPVPVRTLPYALTEDLLAHAAFADFGLPAGKTIFLFIFDFASHYARKNPLGLVRAFKRAFGPTDEALLVLKCSRSYLAPAERAAMQEAVGDAPELRIIDEVLPRGQVISLMQQADCYVSLHRAEGFGLTLAEAMCMGKPVIATGYSGNMDFMTLENSFLVNYQTVPIREAAGPYRRGAVWAEPDLEHAAELMRRVYEHGESARAVGLRARKEVLSQLHPRVVGARVRELLCTDSGDLSELSAGFRIATEEVAE
ncbi:MAG: glycosyltransferase [Rubrivivax sp.]|nr:glycosyltransferase [Pyrinomonadaceae bacterium]